MPRVLTQPLPFDVRTDVDERPARVALRAQIARLEEHLAGHVTTAFPRSPTPPRIGGDRGARLQTPAALGAQQERSRGRLEEIMLYPAEHRWERVTHEDIGEPGCRQCHARPRLGLLGLLMNWWRVIISSGCPLCMRSEGPYLKRCIAPRSPA